ncbi:glucose-1-phosphate adenylyltransferase subunit GlgD [Aquibacillus saliphilus]|uniref:glucose-1-phosphate adenylyltransferase subunit GlgD n=1 Tax=Aquibacillus saliphilus TaxID=1909422 RepID=UPI001CEFDF3D|nr:glucose-1-phosphate adenylyltransferase subunit GlgD [Aquibacillus saliphilus]
MNNILGIIHVANDNKRLQPLTNHRCKASIPFGSRYRMIDFILSSMVNSDIQNIGVFTPLNNRSLLDHLGDGKDWDLDRKQDGLFIFPSDRLKETGNLTAFYSAKDYLEKSSQDYVLLCFDTFITNIDFQPLYKQHVKSRADITIMYKDKQKSDNHFIPIEIDDFQNIIGEPNQSEIGSLDIMILRKEKYLDLLNEHVHKNDDFQDVILYHIQNNSLNIKGFKYNGYVKKISTTQQYFDSNIGLLNLEEMKQLFKENNEIYTKLKDEPPTKYSASSKVNNSLIANGCIIEGNVENSILFRGVHVKRGALIKNSIIMPNCRVGEYAKLDRMILDKEVIVLPYDNLQSSEQEPKVIPKKETARTNV